MFSKVFYSKLIYDNISCNICTSIENYNNVQYLPNL